MARIAVTGAAGFVGSWIANALIEQGHTVLALDDLSGGSRGNLSYDKNLVFEQIDLRDYHRTHQAITDFKPEIIYHLAANAREGASFYQPMSVTSRNIGAYTNVLAAGIQTGVRRFITFSSIAVYGSQSPPFTEDMRKLPQDVYGLAKAHIEDMTKMMSACHGFEYVIVRPHNVVGTGQRTYDKFRNVVGIWMNQIMRMEPITIYGDGNQLRAFSPIEDCLPAFLRCMDCPSGMIFNVGSDAPLRVNTLSMMVRVMMGASNHPVTYLPDRHAEVRFAYSDHTLARKYLGFKDDVGIDESVRRMAKWAREIGPKEWVNNDPIEIPSPKMPSNWAEEE